MESGVLTQTLVPGHDRVCSLANAALEVLVDKQRHQEQCGQCQSQPEWCKAAEQFDREFRTHFNHWLANRPSGGVVTRGARKRSE